MKKTLLSVLLAVTAAILSGCGGGGGGGGSIGDGNLGLFLTDDLNAGYDGVWVRLHKIEFLSAGGAATSFRSADGVEINLRALNVSGVEHYAFFGKDDIPEGTYTGVRVTLGKDVVLFPTGQTAGLQRQFAGLDAQMMKVLSHTYAAPKSLGASDSDIVIDFLLQNWADVGGLIQNAEIGDGSLIGLSDPDLHEEDEFEGQIHGLTGASPFQSFKLANGDGTVVSVKTNESTAVMRSDGSSNPTLQSGQRVEVHGRFVPAEDAVVATSIKIEVDDDDDPEVEGSPFEVDAGSGTFAVEIDEAEGFLPVADYVNIVTNEATMYFGDHGVPLSREEFFSRIGPEGDNEVEVEGPYDSGSNTMTAEKCKIEDEDDEGEIEAEGTASNLNPDAGTFTMTLQEWEGFSGAPGMQISIVTTPETEYEGDDDDGGMNKEEFFALLANNPSARVEAEGRFDGSLFVADELKVEVNDEHEAEGEVTSVNSGAFSFELKLHEWEGFAGSFCQVIAVQTTPTSRFEGPDGGTLTREQFFAELES